MYRNYFAVAFRNFIRNKVTGLINITGLAIGISACLVIFLLVQFDFSFDRFEKDGPRIYRVVDKLSFAGEPFLFSGIPSPVGEAARAEITGLEEVAPFQQFHGDPNVTIPGVAGTKPTTFKKQPDIIYADAHYFNLVPYEWIAGNPQTAFAHPNQVVLTEQRAKTYFPHEDPATVIGRRVTYEDSIVTTISGVVKMPQQHTDFIFKEFVSLMTLQQPSLKEQYGMNTWTSVNSASQLYIKLAKNTSQATITARLEALRKKNSTNPASTEQFSLQPLDDIHFNSDYGTYGDRVAHKPTLYALLLVAIFLLVLGCINFINLSTAQASQRAKEIGIRKTLGSSRKQLVFQFLVETFFITLAATILSVVLTPMLLKVFSDFMPPELSFDLAHQPLIILFLVVLLLVVSFLAGFYPALVLSQYRPVDVLKSQVIRGSSGKIWLRRGLTVSQFLIAQVFVMATIITVRQIHFMTNADLGFKKDGIVTFNTPYNFQNDDELKGRRQVLMHALGSVPGIEKISLVSSMPSGEGWSTAVMTYTDNKKQVQTDVEQKSGDTAYLGLFHIPLLAGRNVQPSDTPREYVINETYLHALGYHDPKAVLGHMTRDKPIVGVMADFHQQSLHKPIKPLAFSASGRGSVLSLALSPQKTGADGWTATMARVEKAYKEIYPDEEFKYSFFDESIARLYKSEQDISRLLRWATGLAIFISCMGLLGLVMYTTHLRKKEIGVRKVLGASVANIVSILSLDFMRLLLIAFVFAVPISWWVMHVWLRNFAYKAAVSWWLFAVSGLIMLAIAWLTLSVQTIRAAMENPVKSLKTE